MAFNKPCTPNELGEGAAEAAPLSSRTRRSPLAAAAADMHLVEHVLQQRNGIVRSLKVRNHVV